MNFAGRLAIYLGSDHYMLERYIRVVEVPPALAMVEEWRREEGS